MAQKKYVPPGFDRHTYVVRDEYDQKIEALAHWKRVKKYQIIDELLGEALQGRKIKPIP